jgi:hypothetical protein
MSTDDVPCADDVIRAKKAAIDAGADYQLAEADYQLAVIYFLRPRLKRVGEEFELLRKEEVSRRVVSDAVMRDLAKIAAVPEWGRALLCHEVEIGVQAMRLFDCLVLIEREAERAWANTKRTTAGPIELDAGPERVFLDELAEARGGVPKRKPPRRSSGRPVGRQALQCFVRHLLDAVYMAGGALSTDKNRGEKRGTLPDALRVLVPYLPPAFVPEDLPATWLSRVHTSWRATAKDLPATWFWRATAK